MKAEIQKLEEKKVILDEVYRKLNEVMQEEDITIMLIENGCLFMPTSNIFTSLQGGPSHTPALIS